MIEFIGYLNKNEITILKIINEVGYSVEENTPLCLLGKEYFGFLKKRQKKVVICSNNIKSRVGFLSLKSNKNEYYEQVSIYMRRALRHESVHIAQACNEGKLLNVKTKRELKIHPYKVNAVIGSSKITGNNKKEYEAYTLEDRPKLIIKALKKYCLY